MTPADEIPARRDWCAVVFALAFPTLVTVVYFVWLARASTPVQQAAGIVGKLIQFVFPVVFVAIIQRRPIAWKNRPRPAELVLGAGLGIALLAATLAAYRFGLKPAGVFGIDAKEAIRQKLAGLGVASVPAYVAIALFYSLIHSLLEEYYWRWFVFGQLRKLTSFPSAIAISSLGFMAHHVCIVSVFFGWFSLWSILLSLAVAMGGVIWASVYERTGSLFAPWISHAFIDAAIFIVGYDLVT
ncbi:MAG TPA: CPBP family intramembrane glutamic endopeptidase [Planctomycetaceae bacterium]|nr:CPBP family intramembrane glutamic endopeptidase [Planctomycetaceae bacterium]